MSITRRLLRDPQAVITTALLVIVFALGLLAPLLAGHDPNDARLDKVNAPFGTPGYLLGGDESGRDILSRLLHAINTSAVSALIGAGVALAIGVTAGLIGGYRGPRTRAGCDWLFNLLMTFPGLLLLIVLMPVTKGDYRVTMMIFGVLLSPNIYRLVRNLVVGVKHNLYIDAARVSRLSDPRILRRHVLFVVRGPIIIAAAFLAGSTIAVQSGLAFLGIGSKEVPSFGAMIASGFGNLYIDAWQFVWPSLTLGLITACLVLLGNALRDALEGARPRPVRRTATAPTPTATTAAATEDDTGSSPLLAIDGLTIAYPTGDDEGTEVVRGVSLSLGASEIVGLVGESGSGKTQTAFAVLGLLPDEAITTRGSIRFDDRELLGLREASRRAIRGRDIGYIPQEPMSNLDPAYTVGAQLVEGLRACTGISRREARERVLELLARVGINEPRRTFGSYPHQISGGMAQRVLIAGAVACNPRLLIADEPTTALDVTVQAEILDLLRDLQQELGMTVLLVTHNFGVVADLCDRVAVMRHGEIVETGDTTALFADPRHPYTRMLLDSILDETTVRSDPPAALAAGKDAS
ncbi:ATP-binding cassette domain-containing protein [Spirillospora sp. CA-255316]